MAHQRKINPGGTRGTIFREVARIRLEDAEVLLKRKRYGGAVYLAGYAVECRLKWAITEQRWPDPYLPAEFEKHDWDLLLDAAQLRRELQKEENDKLRAVYSDLAERWGPELRYQLKVIEPNEAERLYRGIRQVYDWLCDYGSL